MKRTPFRLRDWLLNNSFPLAILFAIWISFTVGGFIRDGMFMGLISSIALWVLIVKLPIWTKRLMGRYLLISDLTLTTIVFVMFTSFIGPGPTAFMAAATQAVTLSVLLLGLRTQYP